MTIRLGHLSDLPYVYEICHRTGYSGEDATPYLSDRLLLGHYYAAPYLVRNPDWCWIACDALGPAGYLVTTPDTQGFADWMAADWLPAIRALYPTQADPAWTAFETWIRNRYIEPEAVPDFVDDYPAHLHIDILPRAQGQGLGSQLFAAFKERCRQRGVSGFHLGVGSKNTKAQGFYRKQGLQLLREVPGALLFGLKV